MLVSTCVQVHNYGTLMLTLLFSTVWVLLLLAAYALCSVAKRADEESEILWRNHATKETASNSRQ